MSYASSEGDKVSGAGVLVIEDFRHSDGSKEPCLVLVQNPKGNYMDFGREYKEKDRSPSKTANKGLFKESLGLYNVADKYFKPLTTVKVPAHKTNGVDTKYKSYIVKINDSARSHFYHNRMMLNLSKKRGIRTPYLHHTNKDVNIVHVPLRNIDFKTLDFDNTAVKDIDGNAINLSGRTTAILKQSRRDIFRHARNERPIARASDIFVNKGNNWADNTMSFLAR